MSTGKTICIHLCTLHQYYFLCRWKYVPIKKTPNFLGVYAVLKLAIGKILFIHAYGAYIIHCTLYLFGTA